MLKLHFLLTKLLMLVKRKVYLLNRIQVQGYSYNKSKVNFPLSLSLVAPSRPADFFALSNTFFQQSHTQILL